MSADFTIIGKATDTVFLLHPRSHEAKQWVEEHLVGEITRFGNGVAVEHRYIGDISGGIKAAGLTINWRPA